MGKFKVGDRVVRVDDTFGSDFIVGSFGIVDKIELDGCCWVNGYIRQRDSIELAWQPKQGEMVDCRDDESEDWYPYPCVFIGMDETAFIVRDTLDDEYMSWEHVRPIKKTHTITLEDGTSVELSEESYKALQEGATK